jgi:hypothetical protein
VIDYIAWGLGAVCVVLICLPPKWDPAIRIKERQIDPRITARLKALNQAAAHQTIARTPYCARGFMDCGSQTCACLDTPHYRGRWQSAHATAIVNQETPR